MKPPQPFDGNLLLFLTVGIMIGLCAHVWGVL